MPSQHKHLWPSRQAPHIAPAQPQTQPPEPAPAEPQIPAAPGPAKRFYYVRDVNFNLDGNLNDGNPDLIAILARLEYHPIGGQPLPGWRLFRQAPLPPGRKTRGQYVAASDTDGSAQVVIFLRDQQAVIGFLRDWASLYQLWPALWHLERLPGVPITL